MNAAKSIKKVMLQLAVDLELGLDAVTQTFAFLARRGAGKTYGASKLAEEMLAAGAQVVAIDPIGCWYALRVAADGKGKGFDIVVLGGLHGDLPLDPGAGTLIANLVVDRGISVVLDVSMMRKGDRKRFVTDFAEQLFARKKSHKSPMHLFLEEAQVFVPQRVQAEEARMLGAFEDLVKLGRNFGIGCTLISQRPQAVNKDVLNQTECLVVLQTSGAQERKALKEWIVEQGIDNTELLATLPSLQKGEAWIWSPSWLRITKRIHIAKKRTLNASATPEHGEAVEAKPLAPIDLEQLREAMKETVTKAAATDPKALQKRVAELERQLLAKAPAVAPVVKVVEKPVLTDEQLKRIESAVALVGTANAALIEVFKPVLAALQAVKAPAIQTMQPRQLATAQGFTPAARPVRQIIMPGRDETLGRCERALLAALGLRHPRPLSRDQVSILSGYSSSSSSFANALGALRSGGFIEGSPDALRLTSAGEAAASDSIGSAPQTATATRQMWHGKLEKAERALFEVLCLMSPEGVTKQELSERSGYSVTSSSFANALGKLRTLGLAVNTSTGVTASADLFEGER